MDKVVITNMTSGRVIIRSPEHHFVHEWKGVGDKYKMDKSLLDEIMYEGAFRYMFETGMLYIEDMEVKKELQLEPEDATEPTNVIALDEAQKKRYLTVLPLFEFKEKVASLSIEIQRELANYAIKNHIIDLDKCDVLAKATGINIVKSIQMERAAKED